MSDLPFDTLLIVDDDEVFRAVLARALGRRGLAVRQAADVDQAWSLAQAQPPEAAVVDLRMPGGSGLVLIERLKRLRPEMRIVLLTGYASIATAVEAIKLGATHYLVKPAEVDEILAALQREQGDAGVEPAEAPLPVKRLEWEHIQKVLAEHDGNISSTARALKMHRRTLQRKLAKKPVGED
ncbi:MAG: response regulator transcription factor [Betaproteobacteria bacterium]|nr:response regulator transcription factor [Betaproteobacteria bacterium]